MSLTAEERAFALAEAKKVHPLFIAHVWTYADNPDVVPSPERIAKTLERMIERVRDREAVWASSGRLWVGRDLLTDDPDGDFDIAVHLTLGNFNPRDQEAY